MVRDHGHGHGDGGPRSSPGPEEGVYILLTILGGRRWLPPISRDAQGERFRHDMSVNVCVFRVAVSQSFDLPGTSD